MARLKKVELLVEDVLTNQPASRTDDFILILEVLSKFVTPKMSLESVFRFHTTLKIPSLESITRCRRKLQEKNPGLRDADTDAIRQSEIGEYKDYAKE